MFKTISIIGGDLRQLTLYRLLKDEGFRVYLNGFDRLEDARELNTEDFSALISADIIILPVPAMSDDTHITAVYGTAAIDIPTLCGSISPDTIVFGGKIRTDISERLRQRGVRVFDYLSREELAVKNAVPTAEGAISIAVNETPYTLHDSRCLVLGFGRIGKILAKMLHAIGAKTSVAARSFADLALISSMGYTPVSMPLNADELKQYDIIFNTVPAVILDGERLRAIRADSLIIDLASRPGGVDFNAAKSAGVKVIWALSLPGKLAPVTSGKIIKDTIFNILKESEV